MDSQVDLNSCTDACTYPKQGVGVTGTHDTVTNRGTQVSMKLCIGGGNRLGQSGGHQFMY